MRALKNALWSFCFVCVLCGVRAATNHSADEAIRKLYWEASSGVWNDSVADDVWTLTLGHVKDTFQSNIRVNFVGGPPVQLLRTAVAIPDDNTFVTPFLFQSFIRAHEARPDLAPLRDDLLAATLNRTMTSLNPNAPPRTPSFGFWPFELNPATGGYRQRSVNMSPFITNGLTFTDIILAFIKKNTLLYNVTEFLKFQFETFEYALNIPADADDTGMNLNTAFLFQKHRAELPKTNAVWDAQEFDLESLIPLLVKFAYCPANTTDPDRSMIDPRSYFWARDFIDHNMTHPDDCIITTWMETVGEELAQWMAGQADTLMPFNINNIESTVATNSLSGLTSLLLQNKTKWFNGPAKQLYLTTANFVAWAMRHQSAITRPDFQNLYYPITMDFVHFFARHLRLLNDYQATGAAWPVEELGQVASWMAEAFVTGGMKFITTSRADPSTCGEASSYCWNGFLGESDVDAQGQPAPNHVDRFFVTASVASALIDSFAVKSNGSSVPPLVWHETTPSLARQYVSGAAEWLIAAVFNETTSYEAAFFSGSIHAGNTMPFGYPVNVMRYMNASTDRFTCNETNFDFTINSLVGVRGKMSDDDFNRVIVSGGCGGWATNFTFQGFNDAQSPWPYWSCPSLTKALAMKVIAEYTVLQASSS